MNQQTVNCATDCVNGCLLGENCPNHEHAQQASRFIHDTSLDTLLEMAEIAQRKKLLEPPQWVIPDDIEL